MEFRFLRGFFNISFYVRVLSDILSSIFSDVFSLYDVLSKWCGLFWREALSCFLICSGVFLSFVLDLFSISPKCGVHLF